MKSEDVPEYVVDIAYEAVQEAIRQNNGSYTLERIIRATLAASWDSIRQGVIE